MPKLSLQLSKLRPTMARYTSALSFGSDANARERMRLYKEAAKKLENGNFSRLIMRIVDKALGIDLPFPVPGRPGDVDNVADA